MDHEAIAHDLLECILLDESKSPTKFPIVLLESITNDFFDDQKIGSGGFADVYKGQLRSGIVAVKKLKELPGKAEDLEVHEKNFIREVDSLMKVKHKNIVRFLGYCFDTQGKVLNHNGKNIVAEERQRFLCFEFLPQGSLHEHISDASRGLDWRTRYHIIKGICEGLHYLHGKKIVHSDLKPQNILLDNDMVPKIGDFGLARSFLEEQTSTMTQHVSGTLGYMAPESFRGQITFKSDIYSLGIIITEMLTGQKKDDLSVENVHEKWTTRFKTSPGGTWLEHVRVCAEIGMECLDYDPKKRPTTGQIIDRLAELEHKFGFIETNLLETHVLDVYPLDIWFPLESDNVIKCPVTLTNRTDNLIGVLVVPSNLDACWNPGYPYVWEKLYVSGESPSIFSRKLEPHSCQTIYMTMRKQEQPPLEAAQEGMFDVLMVATKSENNDLEILDKYWTDVRKVFEDRLSEAKKCGVVVPQAKLRAAVTSDPARWQEVIAHELIQGTTDEMIFHMDVHPTKTWLLLGHFEHVSIWNYKTQLERVTKFQVKCSDRLKFVHRIASIIFIAEEQWLAAGDGYGRVHVYDYSSFGTENKVKEFEAHVGEGDVTGLAEVCGLAVYPKHTLLLTACPKDKVKLWDWSQDWTCTRVIDTSCSGIKAGPRDASSFAHDTDDHQVIKVWDIHSPDPIATFEGYHPTFRTDGDREFLATVSRFLYTTVAKIWDLQTKKCVHSLYMELDVGDERLTALHPTLPILADMIYTPRGCDVHRIIFWDVRTYRIIKRVELNIKDGYPYMLFDGSEDITSLVVCSGKEIQIIKIDAPTLLTGCSK